MLEVHGNEPRGAEHSQTLTASRSAFSSSYCLSPEQQPREKSIPPPHVWTEPSPMQPFVFVLNEYFIPAGVLEMLFGD